MTTPFLKQVRGMGLIEALVAMGITSVVLTGASVLMLYGIRMQKLAGDRTSGRAVAMQQLERLRVLPSAAVEKQIGGNLDANAANHFSVATPGYTTRWTVADGPAGTRDVTLVAVPATPSEPTVRLRGRLWR